MPLTVQRQKAINEFPERVVFCQGGWILSSQGKMRVKIGFVPAHREPFDEEWAIQMRERCLKAFSGVEGLDVVVPESETRRGLVRDDEDAENAIQLFKNFFLIGF